MKNTFFVIIALLALNSCSDAKKSKMGSFGDQFKVQLVNCDGTITHFCKSTGKVSTSKNSNGYYFIDEKSGTLIEVTGNLIISKL